MTPNLPISPAVQEYEDRSRIAKDSPPPTAYRTPAETPTIATVLNIIGGVAVGICLIIAVFDFLTSSFVDGSMAISGVIAGLFMLGFAKLIEKVSLIEHYLSRK